MDGMQKLAKAKAGLILNAPFYATLALGCEYVRRDEVETMATDGKAIFYCEQFVQDCTAAELRGVLAHEVAHIANLHHVRRGQRDPKQWNYACDYAINAQLVAEGFTLPKGALIDAKYDGMASEEIYSAIASSQPPQDGPQGTKQGHGSGNPGQGFPVPGGVMDAAPSADPAALAAAELDAKARTIQAAQAAKAAGKESALGKRAAGVAKESAVDWRAVLRRFVDSAARYEYAWTRPNRRFIGADLYLPGKVPDGMARLAVVIDVSGSINQRALGQFMAELQAACDDAAPDVVDVIQCNTKITQRDTYMHGDAIKPQIVGGGGTNMQPALDACTDASAVIVFTDAEFSKDPRDNGTPTLWAVWGKHAAPAWGEAIALPPA